MQTNLNAVVDPILTRTIDLLAALESDRACDPAIEQQRLLRLFESGDALMGTDRNWQLAKYAVASWIDEMLVDAHWSGAGWWSNNVLEVRLFNSRLCNVRFFELASEAMLPQQRPALAVFHDCVLLGFRGLYAQAGQARAAIEQHKLPLRLEDWLAIVQDMLASESASNAEAGIIRNIAGAPPRDQRRGLVWSSIALALLVAANLVVYQL